MGILNITWESLQKVLPPLDGKKIVDLGDQEFAYPLQYSGLSLRFAKNYYDLLGVSHVSIDWHGKNGAFPVDMSKPIHASFDNRFDILTDFGFSEHVLDQYHNWKNVHDIMAPGGLMIHELPGQAMFPAHETCFWYTPEFFEGLAEKQGYRVVEVRQQYHQWHLSGWVTWVVLVKGDNLFMSPEEFLTLDLRRN
jgi:hypothetical protein